MDAGGRAMGKIYIAVVSIVSLVMLAGCGAVLQGFGVLEQPQFYSVRVGEIATLVRCELDDFFIENRRKHEEIIENGGKHQDKEWQLDLTADAKITLTLTTDDNGTVGYTGIDLQRLG